MINIVNTSKQEPNNKMEPYKIQSSACNERGCVCLKRLCFTHYLSSLSFLFFLNYRLRSLRGVHECTMKSPSTPTRFYRKHVLQTCNRFLSGLSKVQMALPESYTVLWWFCILSMIVLNVPCPQANFSHLLSKHNGTHWRDRLYCMCVMSFPDNFLTFILSLLSTSFSKKVWNIL